MWHNREENTEEEEVFFSVGLLIGAIAPYRI
jgi:hypothetical protein